MDNKKLIIIALVVVAAYFLFFKKKEDVPGVELSEEEQLEAAKRKSAAVYSDNVGDSVSAVTMSAVDEEYNLLRQEAISMGIKVRASWTASQIEDAIEDQKKRNEALDMFIKIADSDEDRAKVTEEMTTSQILSLIEQEKAEQSRAKQAKLQAWEKRKSEIAGYVGNMKQFFTTKWADVTGKTSLLNGAKSLQTAEEKSYFIAKFGTAPVKYNSSSTKTRNKDFVGCCNDYKGYMRNVSKYQGIKDTLSGLAAKFSGVNGNDYVAYESSLKS